MKAQQCPVCGGSGRGRDDRSIYGYLPTTAVDPMGTTAPACHGCDGRGWVAVPEG